jgi:HKD family nuclease
MAALKFILQGFTANTHVDVLQRLFDLPDVQRVLVSVAFVTEGGVEKIEPYLTLHTSHTTVFAGIRNDITTYQGLVRLHGIAGQLYTVDTGSRTVIFHPKIYLVRGGEHARLVVGSANLTLAGLNNNIEAGLVLDLDLGNADDKALVDNIEVLFAASVTDYPDHIVKVGTIADLDKLLAANRLVDELKTLRHRNISGLVDASDDGHDELEDDSDNESRGIPKIKLKVKPLQSGLSRPNALASFFKRKNMPGDDEEDDFSSVPDVSEQVSGKASEVSQTPAVTPTMSSATVTGGVELPTENSPTVPINYYFRPKRRRRGDGPRMRAARAKAEAIRAGKKWYFTGDPCIYGHYADRLVSNGKCRECNRLDCERSNRLGLYR